MYRIALAGNPNAGKTSLFNGLTGSNQHVSNYPGVTVTSKHGTVTHQGETLEMVDLPGIYSLTPYSQEEVIARQVLINQQVDLVVNVLDASNLERNLYLTVQLMEMQVPLVLALNMTDVAEKRGFFVDKAALSRLLGVPVVTTVGNRGEGMSDLLDVCLKALRKEVPCQPRPVSYGHEIELQIDQLAATLSTHPNLPYPPRWVAVKLLEHDDEVDRWFAENPQPGHDRLPEQAQKAIADIERHFGDDAPSIIAERRYGFAAGAVKECMQLRGEARQHITDQIDAVVCHRVLGPIILVAIITALFVCVFKVSDEWRWILLPGGWYSPTMIMEAFFTSLATLVSPLETSAPMLHSLLADAVIGGVGNVMTFIPLIFILFFLVAALEDSGYIARIAFILDRLLHLFGLQGKSILAMIVGGGLGAGGCAVPGVIATRTLREEKDRLITMMVVPFMNCGAKLPVYAMLIAAFFPEDRTRIMMILWAASWMVALSAAWILRRWVIRGEQTPFVMELPPYHVPVLRGLMYHTWDRTWMFIKKAGTLILSINILLWTLMYYPQLPAERLGQLSDGEERASAQLAHSVAGRLGRAMEPVSQLAGFDWQTNIALIGGFAAKEVVVGTLATAYSMQNVDDDNMMSLSEELARHHRWSRLKAFVLMIFVMAYSPCLATIAAIRRETGSWRWALFSTVYSTVIAFVLAVALYQTGKLFGLGG